MKSIALLLLLAPTASAQDLGQQATGLLHTYCAKCHGPAERHGDENYDVTNLDYLRASGLVVAGSPGVSKIMRRLTSVDPEKRMPPQGVPRPTPEEIATISQWISAGAQNPAWAAINESTDQYVLRHTILDQRSSVEGNRRNYRYFSFTNVPRESLPQYHAALGKALNSLTLESSISLPVTIDNDANGKPIGLVVRIDQRDYGWNDNQWQRVLNAYPYFEAPAYLRGDWFIANALKPPIYYDLLGLPNNEQALEQLVGIDTFSNIRGARVVRAGVLNSGVAFHNRVLERHQTRFGAYWKSYDFASSEGRQNILRFPLGPKGTGFDNQAFEENASEIIFNLPNGLHGYFIANAKGQRLNAAPTNIVADRKQVSGSLDVVPGISCIACHSQGIQDKFIDAVRFGSRFNGAAGNRIQSLYIEPERMRAFTSLDKTRYLATVKAVTGDTAEPIGDLALKYHEPLSIDKAATEVGGYTAAQIATAVLVDGNLRALVLPLVRGGTISRDSWESKELGQSPAQRLAELLRN